MCRGKYFEFKMKYIISMLKDFINNKKQFYLQSTISLIRNRNILIKMTSIPLTLSIFYNLGNSKRKRMFLSSDNGLKMVLLPELKESEIREVKLNERSKDLRDSILVIRRNNEYYALSNICPHYGEALDKGITYDYLLKGPSHGVTYDIRTGRCESGPTAKGLLKFEVIQQGDQFYALVNTSQLKSENVYTFPTLAYKDYANNSKYLLVGGGVASLSCAETLREAGFKGEITIYSEEPFLPYDRSKLSKEFINDVSKITLHNDIFFKRYDINFVPNTKVIAIDKNGKTVKLTTGMVTSYDKLLIATGAYPKIPVVEGFDLNNVYYLRNYLDMLKIKQSVLNCNKIAIIGAGFIGMEMASTIKKLHPKADITIIDDHSAAFESVLGKEVSQAIQRFYEKKGIKFIFERELDELVPKKGSVNVEKVHITTKDEKRTSEYIAADMVLLATGIYPNTEVLKQVITLDNGLVKCDPLLNSSDPHIYAAGDVCSYPSIYTSERIISSHFSNAYQQGAIAALNMLGRNVMYDYIPFYSIKLFDMSLSYVGYIGRMGYDKVFIDGSLDQLKFNAYYIKNDELVAFASMNSPNAANIIYESMKNKLIHSVGLIENGEVTIQKLYDKLQKYNSSFTKLDNCAKDLNSISISKI